MRKDIKEQRSGTAPDIQTTSRHGSCRAFRLCEVASGIWSLENPPAAMFWCTKVCAKPDPRAIKISCYQCVPAHSRLHIYRGRSTSGNHFRSPRHHGTDEAISEELPLPWMKSVVIFFNVTFPFKNITFILESLPSSSLPKSRFMS